MDEAAIESMTFQHFPEAFVRDLLHGAYVARRDSYRRTAQEFALPEAENLRGFETRARLEQLTRAVAERHGIDHEVIRPDGRTWYHTEVSSGPVLLTTATVQTPLEMVDPSDYRLSLASEEQMQFA